MNVINAFVDLFFVTVNTGLDVTAIKKYPAHFIDSMYYNKAEEDPTSLTAYLIDGTEIVINWLALNVFGYTETIDLRALGIIIRDFFTDWSDPFDTNTIYYWVRFFAGALPFPFSLFSFCDPVDDVFLNIGYGLRLFWGMSLLSLVVLLIMYYRYCCDTTYRGGSLPHQHLGFQRTLWMDRQCYYHSIHLSSLGRICLFHPSSMHTIGTSDRYWDMAIPYCWYSDSNTISTSHV